MSEAPTRILLVTGMSGAGKSTALQVLEDCGWDAIDNFPLRLLPTLIVGANETPRPVAIGFDSRTRGFSPDDIVAQADGLAARDDVELESLFLDCSDEEIARRYNETRRPHPMARQGSVTEGIAAERTLLAPLAQWANQRIDTDDFKPAQLQQSLREKYGTAGGGDMAITVTSFGFARGMAPNADLLFDMRFLANPYWERSLREQTGMDQGVADHIRADPAFEPAFTRIGDLLTELVPRYAAQDRSYLTIAFGCTGGRHRSVFVAEAVADLLRREGFSPTVRHRDLGDMAHEPGTDGASAG